LRGADAGLAGPVASLPGRGPRDAVQSSHLVPVAVGDQEASHRGGNLDGVQGMPEPGGVRGGVQVETLGFQPGRRLLDGGQVGGVRRRVLRFAAVRRGPGGDVPVGGLSGVQVVVQQPPGRGV
jgi:hypothetical protein